jgi:hypothetical protein
MKKQASVIAVGALLSLAMTATSFAASTHPAKRAKPHATYSHYYNYAPGSYNPAVPEGNYTTFYPSYNGGSVSSAIGGIGH